MVTKVSDRSTKENEHKDKITKESICICMKHLRARAQAHTNGNVVRKVDLEGRFGRYVGR